MRLPKSYTLAQIAEILGCSSKGNDQLLLTGINEIHKVEEGDITFTDVAKYYKKALTSAASCIIINSSDVAAPDGKGLLISPDPFSDYNKLVNFFSAQYPMPVQQYTTGKDVHIGQNSTIYPGVSIGNNITIGSNCTIYPNVVLYDNAFIGDNVIIHANCVIGAHAFYYKNRKTHFEKLQSCGEVIIEDDVEIGACCTIDKGVSGTTRIGKGTKLDNHIHIGHGAVIGKMCLIAAQTGIGGKAIIEDEVIIWGQAGITKDIRIGKGAIISAQAGVSKSLPGGKLYFGSPARDARVAYKELAALRRLANSSGEED